jgi:hypothetical protein
LITAVAAVVEVEAGDVVGGEDLLIVGGDLRHAGTAVGDLLSAAVGPGPAERGDDVAAAGTDFGDRLAVRGL